MAKKEPQGEVVSAREVGAEASATESPEWTPRDYAEFLASDPAAMDELLVPLMSRAAEGIHKTTHLHIEEINRHYAHVMKEIGASPNPESRIPNPSRLLGTGETCVWFEGADESREPQPALVLGNDGMDMLILEVRRPNGVRQEVHGVLHLHSPRLIEETQHRKCGAWELAGVAEERRIAKIQARREAEAKAATARRQRDEAARQQRQEDTPRLLQLVQRQGLSIEEAINQLGPHWTIETAHTAIRHSGRPLPLQTA